MVVTTKNAIFWILHTITRISTHSCRTRSPWKPDIWTALSGRPLRLKSTPTISTERVVFVSVNYGSLLLAPKKHLWHDPGPLGDVVPYP
jgi:hypothetical protein